MTSRRDARPDLLTLTGWLLADLLLGVMVVFLASIPGASHAASPPPPTSSPAPSLPPASTPAPAPPMVSPNPTILTFTTSLAAITGPTTSDGEHERVRREIFRQLQNAGVTGRRAAIVLTFGATLDEGVRLATAVNDLIRSAFPSIFGDAVTNNYHDLDAPRGVVRLQIYFFVT
jgi:hypothetical protein